MGYSTRKGYNDALMILISFVTSYFCEARISAVAVIESKGREKIYVENERGWLCPVSSYYFIRCVVNNELTLPSNYYYTMIWFFKLFLF